MGKLVDTKLDDLLEALKSGKVKLESGLPTFGGEWPTNTDWVWSWDKTRLLVGTSPDDLKIITRNEKTIEAIEKSIAYWEKAVKLAEEGRLRVHHIRDFGGAICDEFMEGKRCYKCPIARAGQRCHKRGSPWLSTFYHIKNRKQYGAAITARQMVELLQELKCAYEAGNPVFTYRVTLMQDVAMRATIKVTAATPELAKIRALAVADNLCDSEWEEYEAEDPYVLRIDVED